MKRVIVILFCAVCGWVSVLAQDHYRIYSHTGKVEYKLALSDIPWQQVQDGMELSIIDSVRIPEGGKVRILRVEPNMLYKPIESGTKDVYHWIKAAQNANSDHIRGTILVDVFSGQKKQIGLVRRLVPANRVRRWRVLLLRKIRCSENGISFMKTIRVRTISSMCSISTN